MLLCGLFMGVACNMGGLYMADDIPPKVPKCKLTIRFLATFSNHAPSVPVPTLMGIFSVSLIFSEIGNGANYALVPHCNPTNNVS